MFGENKNLKDSEKDAIKDTSSIPAPYQSAGFGSGSYIKTHKLITALYMVTDIIDNDEPLRNKLRTLGVEILSDIISKPRLNLAGKIEEVLSFLDIASAMNIISEMNSSILRKEFSELNKSIKETNTKTERNKSINLVDFFAEDLPVIENTGNELRPSLMTSKFNSIGHRGPTRLGVQKGSTLMSALSKVRGMSNTKSSHLPANDFDILKKQRRENIIRIIKSKGGNAAIKDISSEMSAGSSGTPPCSEKTLQRELVSMVKDGVLNKTGEKRWSRYFLK